LLFLGIYPEFFERASSSLEETFFVVNRYLSASTESCNPSKDTSVGDLDTAYLQ